MPSRYLPWLVAVSGLAVLMVSNGMVISGITAFDESLIGDSAGRGDGLW